MRCPTRSEYDSTASHFSSHIGKADAGEEDRCARVDGRSTRSDGDSLLQELVRRIEKCRARLANRRLKYLQRTGGE
jgi:hypothetical protein